MIQFLKKLKSESGPKINQFKNFFSAAKLWNKEMTKNNNSSREVELPKVMMMKRAINKKYKKRKKFRPLRDTPCSRIKHT